MAKGFMISSGFAAQLRDGVRIDQRRMLSVLRSPRRQGNLLGRALRRFELKENLSPGLTVEAYDLVWDSDLGDFAVDVDSTFQLFDAMESNRGRKKDQFGDPNEQGSRGYASKQDPGTWEIVWMQPHPTVIKGDLTADLTAGDTSFFISNAKVMSPVGAIITDSDPTGNITVSNRRFDGDSGDEVIAVWDEAAEVWKTPDVMCPV